MTITPLEFKMMQQRTEAARRVRSLNHAVRIDVPNPDACEQESELHQQIIDECRRREFYFEHCRMDRKTTNGVGSVDFKIAMPGGRTLWIECKRKKSKTTPAQNAVIAHLRKLGHTAAVVWSFQEFINLINQHQ